MAMANAAETLAPEEALLRTWIERRFSGRVVSMERQERWRPAWFVEVETAEGRRSLYARGRREQAELLFFPLAHEAEVLRVLGAAGVPAPRIYGLCEDPEAIIMDRMPGRANLATAHSPAEAAQILLELMDILAEVHAIPPERFAGAGLPIPTDAAGLTFGLFDRFEAIQKANKRRPEPEVAFVMNWLRRNVPAEEIKPAFITCDSGQFLFENGRITTLLDMELAHIGDPAIDLASLLLRDLSEPLGDLGPAFARYAERTGKPIDWLRIHYFIALWGIMTPMVCAHLLRDPPPELDFMYYVDQTLLLTRIPLEAVAEIQGLELEPAPAQAIYTGDGGSGAQRAALKGLMGALADVQPAPGYMRYRRDGAEKVAEYLGVLIEQEGALIAQERAEAAALLGRDVPEEEARDQALEELAWSAGPERDAELTRFFHRRVARRYALMGPKHQLFLRREIQRPDLSVAADPKAAA